MDCGFLRDGRWFRLRAAAFILEDGGVRETMCWLLLNRFWEYAAYPAFLRKGCLT